MTPSYTWTHTPDPAILRRDLVAAQNGHEPCASAVPEFAETCAVVAAEFFKLADDAYRVGDEPNGARLFKQYLAWTFAGEEHDLSLVRLP